MNEDAKFSLARPRGCQNARRCRPASVAACNSAPVCHCQSFLTGRAGGDVLVHASPLTAHRQLLESTSPASRPLVVVLVLVLRASHCRARVEVPAVFAHACAVARNVTSRKASAQQPGGWHNAHHAAMEYENNPNQALDMLLLSDASPSSRLSAASMRPL